MEGWGKSEGVKLERDCGVGIERSGDMVIGGMKCEVGRSRGVCGVESWNGGRGGGL